MQSVYLVPQADWTLVQDSPLKVGAKLTTAFPFTREDDWHFCDCLGCGGAGYFSAEQVAEKVAGLTDLAGATLAVSEAILSGKLPKCRDGVLIIFPGSVWEDEGGIRYWTCLQGVAGYTEVKWKFGRHWPLIHRVEEKTPNYWTRFLRPTGRGCPTSTYFALAE